MKYKKYLKFKDSGVEWLGEVPEHWDIVRNKAVFQFIKSLVGEDSKKYKLLSLTLKGIILRDIESGKGKFPAEFNTYQKVKKNDLIFCLFDIDETPRTIGISKHDGMITGAYDVARCNDKVSDSKFMYYYYLSVDEYKGLKPFYTGLRKVVRAETFMNIQLGLPPFTEQQQIATFLDNATQKMDTLIQKQENLIKLLKEKRQAVISHAVTRGLNPDVKFKDSGVEWLGDVPEHWSTPELIYITKNIGDGLHSTPEYSDNTGYYFINGNNINEGKISINKKTKEVSEKEFHNHYIHLNGSSVFLSINGTIGNVALYNNENVILGKSAAFMNCTNKIIPSYLMHYLLSSQSKNYFDLEVTGTTIYNLSLNSIRKMKICVPPLDEQEEIIKYCFETKNKLDTLIKKSKKSIKLLKEKRTALISSAVIGKIDVRELVS